MARNYGDGSWTEKTVNGIKYQRLTKLYPGLGKNGKTLHKDFYGTTKLECRKKRDAFEGNLKSNMNLDYRYMFLFDYLHRWNDHHYEMRDIRRTTYENYGYTINKAFTDTELGNRTIEQMNKNPETTRLHFIQLLDDFAEKTSSSYVHQLWVLLCKCTREGYDKKIFFENFMAGVKCPESRSPKKKTRITLTQEEQQKLIEEIFIRSDKAVANHKKGALLHERSTLGLAFALFTGCREGEIYALTWDDIDWNEKTIRINKAVKYVHDDDGKAMTIIEAPKSKTSIRTIPMNENTEYLLSLIKNEFEIDKESDPIFVTRQGKIPAKGIIIRTLKRLCEKVGIRACTVHDLRHSYASLIAAEGEPIITLSRLLGHSSISITEQFYIDINMQQQRAVTSTVDNLIKIKKVF